MIIPLKFNITFIITMYLLIYTSKMNNFTLLKSFIIISLISSDCSQTLTHHSRATDLPDRDQIKSSFPKRNILYTFQNVPT